LPKEPKWVAASVVLAIQDAQLAEHGGGAGVRDEGQLESALSRPRNLFAYDNAGLSQLAAAYACGICKNHPFIDGNKRTSLVVAELFLALNGQALDASDVECVMVWQKLAAGELDEPGLTQWFEQHNSGC
jgi:death-on-curing protein